MILLSHRHFTTVEQGVRVMKKNQKKINIILLSANPRGTAALKHLGQEYRNIQNIIESSPFRESFQLDKFEAVRAKDITKIFASSEPQIVHFSGHGSGKSGLALEDDNGNIQLASTEALTELFSLHKKSVKCVFLNACYSSEQAEAISQHIKCVVGMSQRIDDKLAMQFSGAFYQALANGRKFSYCYDLAKTTLQLSGATDFSTAQLLIPENEDIENPLDLKIDETDESQPSYSQTISGVSARGNSTINVIQGDDITVNQNKITQISVDEVKTRALKLDSPYKGLKPFETKDKERFFGREQFLESPLLESLQKTSLLMLLGASGSGKSSVIRAGLIPSLENNSINNFLDLTFIPDDDPFESLYGALMQRGFKQSQAKIVRDKHPGVLCQMVNQLKPANSRWLIVVDQFEELFTVTEESQRDRFINEIVKLSKAYAYDPSLKIVLTMRSDFLNRLDASPANLLARETEGARPIITQMHVDELRLTIEKPAAQHGVVFERGLVEEIISAVVGQAGYLPLLQYTLDLLWEKEKKVRQLQDRTLHTNTYREIGGVRGALQQQIDELYDPLPKSEQMAVQRVFLRLVDIESNKPLNKRGTTVESDWTPVRRRAIKSDFTGEAEQRLIKQLTDANLLVSDDPLPSSKRKHSASHAPTIEIAHEVLLTCWKPLKTWIHENRQAIAFRNRLNDDVTQWKNSKYSTSELWSGAKLEQALELRQNTAFPHVLKEFTPEENKFIENSLNFRERQRKRIMTGLTSFSAVALLLAGFAATQWRRAETSKIQGEIQTSAAEFSASQSSLNSLVASLIAANSLKELPFGNRDNDLEVKVRQALGKSIFSVQETNRLVGHEGDIYSVSFSPDGEIFATASLEGTAKIWELHGEEIITLEGHEDGVTSVAFSPDGEILATASQDGSAKLWTLEGKEIQTLIGHDDEIWNVVFSQDGKKISTASNDGTIRFWSREGQPLPLVLKGSGGRVFDVAFSPGDKTIATANENGSIELWNQQGKKEHLLLQHEGAVLDLKFSLDGKTLLSASDDTTALIWNLENPNDSPTPLGHERAVNSAFFTPNEKYIVTASNDSDIRVWDRQGNLLEIIEGHTDRVNGLSLQPNVSSQEGEFLFASVSDDKTVRLWQHGSTQAQILSGHESPVYAANFLANHYSLVTAGLEGGILFWDENGNNTHKSNVPTGTVYGLSVSSDGKHIASAGEDGAKLWRANGQLVKELSKKSEYFLGVSISPIEQKIAASSNDGTIEIFDFDGDLLTTINAHEGEVYSVNFSADGKRLLTAGVDGEVKLWSQDGSFLRSLGENIGGIYTADFDDKNRLILAGGQDAVVRIWTIDGDPIAELKGHEAAVWGADFSPNGELIATGSDDDTVRLWGKDGSLIATLPSDKYGEANVVSFSAGGRYLVSGHANGTVLKRDIEDLSDLSIDVLIDKGCLWIEDYRTHSLLGIQELVDLDICSS